MNIDGGYARFQVEYENRNDARRMLTGLGDKLIPSLKRCLRDADVNIQIAAVEICDAVPLQYKQAVIELLQFQLKLEEKRTSRNNIQLRNKIKHTLVELGDKKTQAKTKAELSSDNRESREQAVNTLGANPEANKAELINIAQTDEEFRVRRTAIGQLGKLQDDPDLINIYESALKDESTYVRQSAIGALLKSKVDDERIEALALRALDDDDIQVIGRTLQNVNRKSFPAIVPRMMQLLSEVPPGWKGTVVHGLRLQVLNFGNLPDDWQPLIDLINSVDEYPDVNIGARGAITALGAMSDFSAMPTFIGYMIRDATYEGDPNQKPSFAVLHTLKDMREKLDWKDLRNAIEPYIDSENVLKRRAVIQIILYVDKYQGELMLRKMRANETDTELKEILDDYIT